MRTVSLRQPCLSSVVDGGVLPAALCLADVNDDCRVELLVGTTTGKLFVFGADSSQPLFVCEQLGFITAVCCGRLVPGRPSCVVIACGDGLLHILCVQRDEPTLRRLHCQRVPANVKQCLLHDIDGDGAVELVVALTDRVVRVYRWCGETHGLRAACKCELMQQIGNVAVMCSHDDHARSLLVSQPGGAVVRLQFARESAGGQCVSLSVSVHDVHGPVNSHVNTCSEVVVWSEQHGEQEDAIGEGHAVLTQCGRLILCARDGGVTWSARLHHQLFASQCVRLADGGRQLAACSWDGHTFVMDQRRRIVQFLFADSVLAFTAGQFDTVGSCLVHVTSGGRVVVHALHSLCMTTRCLLQHVQRLSPHIDRRLALSPRARRALHRWCLYSAHAVSLSCSLNSCASEQSCDGAENQYQQSEAVTESVDDS